MAIKNYLKDVKKITAPLNWKSSPDSPSTQLAYVTKPEIDLLVKANLHGSMDGKPNKGPKGIISLDGGGIEEAYSEKISDKPFSSNVISSGSNASPHGGGNFPIIGGSGPEGSGSGMSSIGQTIFNITNQGSGSGQGTDTSGSDQGTDTSGSDQGTDSSDTSDEGEGIDDIIFKVLTGPEINKLDPFQMRRVKSILDNYIRLGETNPLKLRALMTGNIAGGIFGKDQTVSDMEGNIVKPEDALNPDGTLKEGFRFTKEGIIGQLENIDSESKIMESLKMFNPELYYPFMGMPATSGSLADLGSQAAIDTTGMDRESDEYKQAVEYNNMIFSARSELDRMGKDMFGNTQGGGQGGISNISIPQTGPTSPGPTTGPVIPNQYGAFIGKPGPFIANFVDSDGDGVDDRFQSGPGQPSSQLSDMKKPLPTTGIVQAVEVPAAFNYANIAPQFTGYTNQGVSPMLGDYYGNLRRFYG